jgi:hypothetical protein
VVIILGISITLVLEEWRDKGTIDLSGRYFLQWFALDGSDDSPIFRNPGGIKSLATNAEFRNQVALRVDTREELQAVYKETDSLAVRLLEVLRPKGS